MYYAAGRDILNSLVQGHGSVKVYETMKQIDALTTYSNTAIVKAHKRYCLTTSCDLIAMPTLYGTVDSNYHIRDVTDHFKEKTNKDVTTHYHYYNMKAFLETLASAGSSASS